MCESGGDGGGNDGGATGQAGHGGSGVGSAEADSGYGTSSSGWGAADNGNGGANDGGGSGSSNAAPTSRDRRGYTPSSREDRHGTTTGKRGLAGSTRDGVVDAAVDDGYGNIAGFVGGLIGPAVGFAAKSAIDGVTAANMDAAVMGYDPDFGDYAANTRDRAFDNAVGSVVGMTTGTIGGKLGASIGGVPGAVVGGIAGSQFGKGLLGDPGSSSPGANSSKGFDGFGNESTESVDVASANVGQPGNPSVNTGWNSKFGDYNSHVSGFKSYGSNSALDAFS